VSSSIESVELRQALRDAVERLTRERVPSPRLNAELLIMFTLDCNRAYLYAHPERELTPDEVSRYDDAIARRITGVPAQYITGHQEFWGLDLIVSPGVLIPRPETERVVETVLELAGDLTLARDHERRAGASVPRELHIIDIGTGSGAIALALAKELPSAEIHASDISVEALEIAKANAARHELDSRIRFHRGDLFAGLSEVAALTGQFDFVVSNPPYVGESEEDQVQLDVRKFEPRNAVFAGPTGVEAIERLIPQAEKALCPGGWLVIEISSSIVDGVRRLLSRWDEASVRNDLQGIARVAVARRRGST